MEKEEKAVTIAPNTLANATKYNIYKRMLDVESELRIVAKNLNVGYGNFKYRATGEADVLLAIKPLEAKHGIYSYPYKRTIIKEKELEKGYMERVETVYRFVNVDDPSDFLDITSYGDGIDTGDKGPGKAMTYCDKYALMKAYKIVTGDDPDQDPSPAGNTATLGEAGKISSNKPTAETLAKAQELGIKVGNVAIYFKKKEDEVTDSELKQCIEAKEKHNGKKEETNGK